ncbi:MAG: hypothetical protein E7541_02290 [Ruminococcaceae bacterium]|nr:hypothetical protein [Oscillospiraceae bacterium]
MKAIGFIDYYLSEWHANNYPQWIKEVCQRTGLDYTVAYAWGEQDISPVDGVTGAQWCEKMGVTLCPTLEEVCQKSDVLIILAPSDPEKHLGYAQQVLSYGKPTYIDKTFAPDGETAKAIFALGEQYNTPFFSTSALRYAEELADMPPVRGLSVMGGGGNFPEYVIHLVEMAVAVTPSPFHRVKVHVAGERRLCCLETVDKDTAAMVYCPGMDFALGGDTADGQPVYRVVQSDFFPRLIESILRFFEDGKLPFDPAQTLQAMAVRDALLLAEKQPDVWVSVKQ